MKASKEPSLTLRPKQIGLRVILAAAIGASGCNKAPSLESSYPGELTPDKKVDQIEIYRERIKRLVELAIEIRELRRSEELKKDENGWEKWAILEDQFRETFNSLKNLEKEGGKLKVINTLPPNELRDFSEQLLSQMVSNAFQSGLAAGSKAPIDPLVLIDDDAAKEMLNLIFSSLNERKMNDPEREEFTRFYASVITAFGILNETNVNIITKLTLEECEKIDPDPRIVSTLVSLGEVSIDKLQELIQSNNEVVAISGWEKLANQAKEHPKALETLNREMQKRFEKPSKNEEIMRLMVRIILSLSDSSFLEDETINSFISFVESRIYQNYEDNEDAIVTLSVMTSGNLLNANQKNRIAKILVKKAESDLREACVNLKEASDLDAEVKKENRRLQRQACQLAQ